MAGAPAAAPAPPGPARSTSQRHLGALARLHEAMRAGAAPPPEVVDTLASLDGDDGLSLYDFLHDDRVFAELCAEYDAHQPETSFIDYFWTLRTMHVPLFKLAAIARSLPRFRALHAVSTGYAGRARRAVAAPDEAPVHPDRARHLHEGAHDRSRPRGLDQGRAGRRGSRSAFG